MGNETSSLPADVPKDLVDEVLNKGNYSNLTEEEFNKMVVKKLEGKSSKKNRRTSHKLSKSQSQRKVGVERRNTLLVQEEHKKKRQSRRSSVKTLDQYFADQKKEQMDPQEVLSMLEEYSTANPQIAEQYFKSLQRPTPIRKSNSAVPKAA